MNFITAFSMMEGDWGHALSQSKHTVKVLTVQTKGTGGSLYNVQARVCVARVSSQKL